MAAPGAAQVAVTLPSSSNTSDTNALLAAMLHACDQISDLIFSPGCTPQVEVNGLLLPVQAPGLRPLTADDTRRIASDLIGGNKQAINMLREQGSCDVSFALPGLARFRVNVFIQRGSCAIVMRVIPTVIPDFHTLGLPSQLEEVATLRDGIVLVTGPRGSGKSSTLAALIDRINELQTCHILTIEDPIEFLHKHKRSMVHQRELHSDAPNYGVAIRAAMRQAPNVIFVGEMRDRETMEMVLDAAETGHLVLSSLNTVDAAKTVDRMAGVFPHPEQSSVRSRLSKTLRYVVSQRLLPRKNGKGQVAAIEILHVTPSVLELLQHEDNSGEKLLHAMKEGAAQGMQYFDGEIAKLVRTGVVDAETAMAYATNPLELHQVLGKPE